MNDIANMPFAFFMEDALRQLTELGAEKIGLVAFAGERVYTGYWNCGNWDKHVMAGTITGDACYEMVLANAREVAEAAEEDNRADLCGGLDPA